jgi:hypothetical protein
MSLSLNNDEEKLMKDARFMAIESVASFIVRMGVDLLQKEELVRFASVGHMRPTMI